MNTTSFLKFQDISNTIDSSQCSKDTRLFFRRKAEVQTQAKKRPVTSQQHDRSMVCFIPMNKIDRCSSHLLLQHPISTQVSKENSTDKLNATMDQDRGPRRFARNTDKVFAKPAAEDHKKEEQCCQSKSCMKEKATMSDKIRTVMAINHHLTMENERLNNLIGNINAKVSALTEDIREKTLRIEQLSRHLQHKQKGSHHLEEVLRSKDRIIMRLQENLQNLQKHKSASTSRVSQPQPTELNEIIHQLTQKLKYKEIESHIFRKEKQAFHNLEREHKALLKENSILKERLSYYMKLKEQRRAPLKESMSSLSLSVTSVTSWLNTREGEKTDREIPIIQSSL